MGRQFTASFFSPEEGNEIYSYQSPISIMHLFEARINFSLFSIKHLILKVGLKTLIGFKKKLKKKRPYLIPPKHMGGGKVWKACLSLIKNPPICRIVKKVSWLYFHIFLQKENTLYLIIQLPLNLGQSSWIKALGKLSFHTKSQ